MTDPLESNVDRLVKAWADPLDEPRVDELSEKFLGRLRSGEPVRRTRVWGRIGMAASLAAFAWIVWIVVASRPAATPPATPACQEEKAEVWPKRHTVEEGESYATICRMYYGDDSYWKLLVDANPDVNPFRLTKGQVLVIPRKAQEEIQVVQVKTAQELIDAIAPSTTIELAPGTYNLSTVNMKQSDYILWEEETDGYQLKIRNVSNLQIRGPKQETATILAEPRYGWVLMFAGCRDVVLSDLVLGHTLKGYCTGGVLEWKSCGKIRIENCDLFGCGTEGMNLEQVKELRFLNSRIRDCTYGIMTVSGSSKLEFVDSRFENNRQFDGFSIRDSKDILFDRCTIARNDVSNPLFQLTSCSRILVKNSTLLDNKAEKLFSGPLEMEGTAVRENSFREK